MAEFNASGPAVLAVLIDPATGLPYSAATGATGPLGGGVVSISGDVTITSGNAATYNGMTLVFAAAHTVTLDVGLPSNFGFAAQPPVSGNASIASDGTVLLNGATTTITRALSGNVLFGVAAVGTNSYAVTGS